VAGGAAVLVAVTAVTVWAVNAQADGCGGGGALKLTVAAAPEIQPAVQDAAALWSRSNPVVNGECVRVDVRAVESADMAQALAKTTGGRIDVGAKSRPDDAAARDAAVWIPDSMAWVNRVIAVNRDMFDTEVPSIASSPIAMGLPQAVAAKATARTEGKLDRALIGESMKQALTTGKPGDLRLAVADPRHDSASLAGAIILHDMLVHSQQDLPTLVGAYRVVGAHRSADTTALTSLFAGQEINAAPMSEQAVINYDSTHPDRPLTAALLNGNAVLGLDYPYAELAGRPRGVTRAADLFRSALTGTTLQTAFAKRGFRAPDGTAVEGFPSTHAASPDRITAPAINDPAKVGRVLTIWGGANTASNLLALADVTASMNTLMGSTRRIDVLRGAATKGLTLFTPDSRVGLWAYAAGLGGPKVDYAKAVDIAPLSKDQVAKVDGAIQQMQAVPTDACGVYETVLDAYRAMQSKYQPTMSNTIVVFTDGRENKPGALGQDDALTQLETLVDVTKPIRVIVLNIGPDATDEGLSNLAKATGGKAFKVSNPDEINLIFLKALLRVDD
jgi:Ca-activated chloride channel family protein